MGSGKTISLAGPSIVFVYLIIGAMLFFVMRAMGELLLSNLQYKSFIDFSTDLLGPWAGFFCGWTYWFCWIVTAIADVIAIAAYAQFWFPGLEAWKPALACVMLLLALNLVTVKLFGEMEFWFALIKIVAICALIITGAGLVAWGFTSPSGHTASLSNLWNDGGMFPMGLVGFFAGFQIAVFAFVGIELVGTTAAETADPERNLPKAINSIPVRIIIFYVLALIAIMAVTPWRQVVPDKSPFVQLFVLAGIPAAASLINFVVLTSATSSANSGIFSTSRMLYGLAEEGHAPRGLSRLSRGGAGPRPAVLLPVPAGRHAADLPDSEPGDRLHPGDHAGHRAVHLRLVADPGGLHGLPPPLPGAPRRLDLQDARRRRHVLGLPGVLRRRAGAAEPAGRHPPGADRQPGVVRAAGRGVLGAAEDREVTNGSSHRCGRESTTQAWIDCPTREIGRCR
jgi:hypothetical protein